MAPENAIVASGGAAAVSITTQPECAWTATAEGGWISELAPSSGQGSGEVQFRGLPNPDGTTRQAAIEVNGQRAVIRQDASPCRWDLVLSNERFDVTGGVATVEVSAPGGCAWAASSGESWIVISAPGTGTGRGTVSFRVTANLGQARRGTIAIGGAEVTVTQEAVVESPPPPDPVPPRPEPPSGAPPACTRSLQPTAASMPSSGGSGVLTITTRADCAWTARSLAAWVTISNGATGTGSATVAFTVAANSGAARIGMLEVGGETFTLTQEGVSQVSCSYAIDRASQSVAAAGTNGATVAVSTSAGCGWTAASNAGWITITSGASGSGNGQVAFNVAANTGGARSGTLTIGGRTLSIEQAADCSYSINPQSHSVSAAGGAGPSIAVSTAGGCNWTATSNAAWLTIASGASGTGNGSVGFNIATNSGGGRTGTLTVAGRTFTVSQAGACVFSINPDSARLGKKGGNGPNVEVDTTPGCAWTAVSQADWLTITSGASGTGDGTVRFKAESFSGDSRTGVLTIAGKTLTVTQVGSGKDDDD